MAAHRQASIGLSASDDKTVTVVTASSRRGSSATTGTSSTNILQVTHCYSVCRISSGLSYLLPVLRPEEGGVRAERIADLQSCRRGVCMHRKRFTAVEHGRVRALLSVDGTAKWSGHCSRLQMMADSYFPIRDSFCAT